MIPLAVSRLIEASAAEHEVPDASRAFVQSRAGQASQGLVGVQPQWML